MSEVSAGRRYLRAAVELTGRLESVAWPRIEAGAALIADALASGAAIHVFGTGHSHMLAEELYYRAGGLVRVRPILFEGLMLHASASGSTLLERLPGLAAALLADHPMNAGDVILVASSSGRNAVVTEMARLARERGVTVIAITSLAHATSEAARERGGPALHELADVVIDNGGCVGDAAVRIEGLASAVGPNVDGGRCRHRQCSRRGSRRASRPRGDTAAGLQLGQRRGRRCPERAPPPAGRAVGPGRLAPTTPRSPRPGESPPGPKSWVGARWSHGSSGASRSSVVSGDFRDAVALLQQ